MAEGLKSSTLTRAGALVSAALLLAFVAIGARVIALLGGFPPHPWIYGLLALIALICATLAIILAALGFRRDVRWSLLAMVAIILGVVPLLEMLVEFIWGDIVLATGGA